MPAMSKEELKVAIAGILTETRNGTSLQGSLVEVLGAYFLGTLMEVPKDMPETVEEWLAAAKQAYEERSEEPFKSGIVCNLCGEKGHIAKNCPNKKEQDDE